MHSYMQYPMNSMHVNPRC